MTTSREIVKDDITGVLREREDSSLTKKVKGQAKRKIAIEKNLENIQLK